MVTNLYATLLAEMAEKVGDLEQSLVPDAQILPDPRESRATRKASKASKR